MEALRVAGPNICPHPVPGDGGGSHPEQLQPLPQGRRAQRVAPGPAAWPQGALDILVGG